MRIAIVDDLAAERALLKDRLEQQLHRRNVQADILEYESGETFLEAARKAPFTAAFLDIYMDGMTGMEAAKKLRKTNTDCLLFFPTTSTDHALEGFQVRALHYLVKPFTEADIDALTDELLARIPQPDKYMELKVEGSEIHLRYDRSNGFYRRQLILTTKEKPADRVDDPDIAEKMKLEIEGIFLWAFEGLQRLAANNFRFTESPRTLNNREYVKRDANNAIDFMESTGYIRLKADMSVTSKELYAIYGIWCDENGLTPIRQRSFSDFLMRNLKTYNLEHTNTVTNATGRRVWGYLGIEPLISPRISENWGNSLCTYVPES